MTCAVSEALQQTSLLTRRALHGTGPGQVGMYLFATSISEDIVDSVCRLAALVVLGALWLMVISCPFAAASDNVSRMWSHWDRELVGALPSDAGPPAGISLTPQQTNPDPSSDFLVKLAYGRTFGTSTELDYATVEVSRPVRKYPADTGWGPALGELQLALLGSYVLYYEGNIERTKKLNFRDGYEFGGFPKGRFTFPRCLIGLDAYMESGAGMSYVSETYRNSGSRWNWLLMGGFGVERSLPGRGTVCLGVQWRHLSNGNMWGKGDELHNSNSGTDMVQGIATFMRRF